MRLAVVFLTVLAGVVLDSPPMRSRTPDGATIDVIHYELSLTPDLASGTVRGEEEIQFRLAQPAAAIEFDRGNLRIARAHDRGRPVAVEQADRLTLRWPQPLAADTTHTVSVTYTGSPTSGITFDAARQQVYTVFNTSQWMVALDTPAERATFRLQLHVPPSWTTAASGELERPPGAATPGVHTWSLRTAAPSYVYGFAAGRFRDVTTRVDGRQLRYLGDGFTDAELQQVFRDSADMLAFFERRAGIPFAGKTYTQVLTSKGIGQELMFMALLPESYGRDVLANERESWLSAHEIAHQWWGNLVTCANWTHFWLNEGFATFMVAAHKEHRWGPDEYEREMARIEARYRRVVAAGKDRSLVFSEWTRPTADDRTIVYQKGAYVLHLLRRELGDELFWKAIAEYTRASAGRSVTTEDFQHAVERATGRSLAAFFAEWVYGARPR